MLYHLCTSNTGISPCNRGYCFVILFACFSCFSFTRVAVHSVNALGINCNKNVSWQCVKLFSVFKELQSKENKDYISERNSLLVLVTCLDEECIHRFWGILHWWKLEVCCSDIFLSGFPFLLYFPCWCAFSYPVAP